MYLRFTCFIHIKNAIATKKGIDMYFSIKYVFFVSGFTLAGYLGQPTTIHAQVPHVVLPAEGGAGNGYMWSLLPALCTIYHSGNCYNHVTDLTLCVRWLFSLTESVSEQTHRPSLLCFLPRERQCAVLVCYRNGHDRDFKKSELFPSQLN